MTAGKGKTRLVFEKNSTSIDPEFKSILFFLTISFTEITNDFV